MANRISVPRTVEEVLAVVAADADGLEARGGGGGGAGGFPDAYAPEEVGGVPGGAIGGEEGGGGGLFACCGDEAARILVFSGWGGSFGVVKNYGAWNWAWC